jgi:HEAT repeat protein
VTEGESRLALSAGEVGRIEEVDRHFALGEDGVAPLIEMLADRSWAVRRAVVAALASLGTAAVGPLCASLRQRRDDEARVAATVDALAASGGTADDAVIALTRDQNPAVVADAAQILGRRRAAGAVPPLVALIGHHDDNVAVAAIEALGRIGGRSAVESLVEATQSGNFFRTFPAIDVLGRSGDPRAVAPLAALLTEPQYAAEAARALGRTAAKSAIAPLIDLMNRAGEANIRVAALAVADLHARYVERYGTATAVDELIRSETARGPTVVRRLTQAIAGGDPVEQAAICFVLGAIGDDAAVPQLTALLEGPSSVAAHAAQSLKRLGPEADKQVLEAIRAGDSARKRALLPLVSRSTGVADVVACLGDPDPGVRTLACEALARIGNPAAVQPLFPLLSDPSARVTFAAIAAIQSLGSRETERLALAAARSQEPGVRRAAMRILAYFGYLSALDVFLAALGDPDRRIADSAIQGLPFIEDPRALEALLSCAGSDSPQTRAAAMRALGQSSRDARVTSYLLKGAEDPDSWVRYYACQALGRLGFEGAAEVITRLLHDQAGQVRVAAVEALASFTSPVAVEALRTAAGDRDPDIRRAALVGLGVAKRADALPIILAATASDDASTRLVAISAIGGFESPDALTALARAASDLDEGVRSAAIGYLAARPGQAATDVLIHLLRGSGDRERVLAALAIPTVGRIAGLVAALEMADDELAPQLASALARLRRPDATAALLEALSSPNVRARKAVATTLAAIGSKDVLAALKRSASSDPDPEMRLICSLLLSQ